MKRWCKVTLELDPVLSEAMSDFLVGVLAAGVEAAEEREGGLQTLHVFSGQENPDEEEVARLVGSIRSHAESLAEIFQTAVPRLAWEWYQEEDWGGNWKKHFVPFAVVPGLVIAPTWEGYAPQAGEKVLVMDPGMAFGTGHHATTALALEYLRQCLEEAGRPLGVLDVGTGTGVLGMAAALFGAERVDGIDNDPVAVEVAAENVRRNGLAEVMRVSATPLAGIAGRYPVVVANIVHDVLAELAEDLAGATEAGGFLILSGILAGAQVDSLEAVFARYGLLGRDRRVRGEWAALLLQKPSDP